ncbi:D-alanine-D-alanine ligase [Paramyrothecium foliicola]|nr:D-alanine-D-alanine ligase [Paramyrothecium foliicola]
MANSNQIQPRVAILFQAIEPPTIQGSKKPMKPGGYQDSGSDIAYSLSLMPDVQVITPVAKPDPTKQSDWCFPDTEQGLITLLEHGVTHIWANTILFAAHPLQTSLAAARFGDTVQVIGQPPLLVEQYDDKELVNNLLRKAGGFDMPQAWTIHRQANLSDHLGGLGLSFPVVGKPLRGRGSQGVKVCSSLEELTKHAEQLLVDSSAMLVEEYLSGEEATVTVMPPTGDHAGYWALPVVRRFNHIDGVAPYNGVVAVTANSKAITGEAASDPVVLEAMRQCERAAKLLGPTAPIRIDIRRFKDDQKSKFALFDVNMKPNMTGPGRPGREDQASLTLVAGEALGWDFARLLREILKTAVPLESLRNKKGRL